MNRGKTVAGSISFFFGLAAVAYASRLPIINTVIDQLLRPLVNLLLILGTAIFGWGIIEYIAGASNETARTTGRQHMLWGVAGLLIMTSTYFILSILRSFFYP